MQPPRPQSWGKGGHECWGRHCHGFKTPGGRARPPTRPCRKAQRRLCWPGQAHAALLSRSQAWRQGPWTDLPQRDVRSHGGTGASGRKARGPESHSQSPLPLWSLDYSPRSIMTATGSGPRRRRDLPQATWLGVLGDRVPEKLPSFLGSKWKNPKHPQLPGAQKAAMPSIIKSPLKAQEN